MTNFFGPPRLDAIIKPYMIKKALGNTRKYDVFHPSAWGSCLRKICYQHYNESEKFVKLSPQDIDVRTERIYDNGHGIHARWQNYLDNAGILRGAWKCSNPECGRTHGTEDPLGVFNPQRTNAGWKCACGNGKKLVYEELLIKTAPEYNFEGHCDAVVDLRDTPFKTGGDLDVFVVDFKSINDKNFFELEYAKHEHVIQTHIYMWVLGLRGAVVLYENKNSQAVKEIFVPRDENIVDQIKEEALWLMDVIKRRKLPPRPDGYMRSAFPCRYCEFANMCFSK